MSDKVLIMMASYNGSEFLEEQIESIVAQSYQEWELWIRDDGSRDDTVDIVHAFCEKDERIKFISDGCSGAGACGNFSKLMDRAKRESDAMYFSFSDQDDVWECEKISVQLETISKLPFSEPALVFSNLCVVDTDLRVINKSFWDMEKIFPEKDVNLLSILGGNIVTGCTILMNRKALEMSSPVPSVAIMHDWWIALKVYLYGKVAYVERPLVQYRQHGKNDVGANRRGVFSSLKRNIIQPIAAYERIMKLHRLEVLQARELLVDESLDDSSRFLVERFCDIRDGSFFARLINHNVLRGRSVSKLANIFIP